MLQNQNQIYQYSPIKYFHFFFEGINITKTVLNNKILLNLNNAEIYIFFFLPFQPYLSAIARTKQDGFSKYLIFFFRFLLLQMHLGFVVCHKMQMGVRALLAKRTIIYTNNNAKSRTQTHIYGLKLKDLIFFELLKNIIIH
jgi:hypothetical protein